MGLFPDARRLKSIRLETYLDTPDKNAALDRIKRAGFHCAVDDDPKNILCLKESAART